MLLQIPSHAVLLDKQNTSTGAVLQLLPLLHKYTVASTPAQSIHSKQEQTHRYLAPKLLSFAALLTLLQLFGRAVWLTAKVRSTGSQETEQSSSMPESCPKNKTDIYHTEQRKLDAFKNLNQ